MNDAPVAVPEKRKPGRPKKALTEPQIEALDHDDDGHAGGSLPHKLPPREVEALIREAGEAYQMQDERKREDSLRRRWTFRPSSQRDHASLMLECYRGVEGQARFIMNDRLGIASREDAIREAVESLIENV